MTTIETLLGLMIRYMLLRANYNNDIQNVQLENTPKIYVIICIKYTILNFFAIF